MSVYTPRCRRMTIKPVGAFLWQTEAVQLMQSLANRGFAWPLETSACCRCRIPKNPIPRMTWFHAVFFKNVASVDAEEGTCLFIC
jgi:hypothetical protein